MKRIPIVTSNPNIIACCQELLRRDGFEDIELIVCSAPRDYETMLDQLALKDVEVVISRGERASYIAESLAAPVIELPSTGLNLLQALEKASRHGKRIGLIGPQRLFYGARKLAELLHIQLYSYLVEQTNPETLVAQALKDAVDAIVGGYNALGRFENIKCPVFIVGIDEESILKAIDEARRTASALGKQRKHERLLSTILEHSYEGVIAADKDGQIFLFNPAAQRMLGVTAAQSLNHNLDELCKPFSLREVILSGTSSYGTIVQYSDNSFVCNKIIVNEDDLFCGISTFQEVSHIQRIEASVRRKICDGGLVAEGTFDSIVGKNGLLERAKSVAKDFALTNSSILVLGESGTGKELFTQSIHNYSSRKDGPFVAVNCAALPAELLESELFGYDAGAFTGARAKGKAGLFELAHGGTLFLDEIAEMPLQLQGKMLRVLQERKIMRLGSDRVLPVDVRILAATNRNMATCIKNGMFRQDLYYRLNVLRIVLPPLRACTDDIALLSKLFLYKHTGNSETKSVFTANAIKVLQGYAWPGNVRELSNIMERLAVMYGKQGTINSANIRSALDEEMNLSYDLNLPDVPEEDDVAEIRRVLATVSNNYTQAAKILGLSRVTLWRKLKRGTGQH